MFQRMMLLISVPSLHANAKTASVCVSPWTNYSQAESAWLASYIIEMAY